MSYLNSEGFVKKEPTRKPFKVIKKNKEKLAAIINLILYLNSKDSSKEELPSKPSKLLKTLVALRESIYSSSKDSNKGYPLTRPTTSSIVLRRHITPKLKD
jgi:hypothetical protein